MTRRISPAPASGLVASGRAGEMGRAARAVYAEKYTAERNLPQLLKIYDEAIEHRAAHPD